MPGLVEIEVARSSDVEEIAGVLGEGAAWMAAKGCPAWTPAMLSEPVLAASVARGEFLVARAAGRVAGVCTLSRVDPVFWPEDAPGEAAYLHRLAVRRAFAGQSVTPALVAACEEIARGWGRAFLRLDCHRMIRPVYDALGFVYVDTREVCEEGGSPMIVDRLQRRL